MKKWWIGMGPVGEVDGLRLMPMDVYEWVRMVD